MSFLDKFKKKKDQGGEEKEKGQVEMKTAEEKAVKKPESKPETFKAAPAAALKKEKFIPKPSKDDTGNAYKVLIRPMLTEKITDLGAMNKYAFAVAGDTTKSEVKKAIRHLYGVEVIQVNIINLSGKKIRYGKTSGRTSNWKKAIITLKSGEKIQVYEGV